MEVEWTDRNANKRRGTERHKDRIAQRSGGGSDGGGDHTKWKGFRAVLQMRLDNMCKWPIAMRADGRGPAWR
ncbi:hypothetical protein GOP47_0008607 [Adiantum capillus-veneris]|uniref:Uncharacterized protein n=1 Tax=Adiantum capillus-veneris TaxID=13818 RepID=A0A9D4V057_ADICA|nr:hypothetical protein GOP47_0008607 [Adiantum capillus-veneris]